VRLSSTEKITGNIKLSIEPARNIMENNKDLDTDFDQLKNIIIHKITQILSISTNNMEQMPNLY